MIESPINKTIFFDEPTHTYTDLNGNKYISCSTLVHKFEKPFDEDGSVTRRVAEREGVSVEEIKEKWLRITEEACSSGSLIHAELEYFVINKKIKKDGIYKDIVKNFKKIKFNGELQSEVVLTHPKYRLAGTLDLVELEGNTCSLKDFKSNKTLKKFCPYGNRMLPPFHRYFSHSFQKYTFQLNLYALLLEEAGYWVKDLTIFHINQKTSKIEVHPVPFIRKDAIKMMEFAPQFAAEL